MSENDLDTCILNLKEVLGIQSLSPTLEDYEVRRLKEVLKILMKKESINEDR